MTLSEHPSSSSTQLLAEKEIVEALAQLWNIDLRTQPGKVMVADGVNVEVDAATADFGVVVEAYARQGRLKGARDGPPSRAPPWRPRHPRAATDGSPEPD